MRSQRGFTLPEVIAVIGIVGLLLGASMLFVRPKDYANSNSDSQRQLGIAAIAQGLRDYRRAYGDWPANIPAKDTPIGTGKGNFDLCSYLVPAFLNGIPLDPATGTQYTGDDANPTVSTQSCNVPGVKYTSGYAVRKDDKGMTVSAGSTVGAVLTVTVK